VAPSCCISLKSHCVSFTWHWPQIPLALNSLCLSPHLHCISDLDTVPGGRAECPLVTTESALRGCKYLLPAVLPLFLCETALAYNTDLPMLVLLPLGTLWWPELSPGSLLWVQFLWSHDKSQPHGLEKLYFEDPAVYMRPRLFSVLNWLGHYSDTVHSTTSWILSFKGTKMKSFCFTCWEANLSPNPLCVWSQGSIFQDTSCIWRTPSLTYMPWCTRLLSPAHFLCVHFSLLFSSGLTVLTPFFSEFCFLPSTSEKTTWLFDLEMLQRKQQGASYKIGLASRSRPRQR
jgi:hypothetical protein